MNHINITNWQGNITDWTKFNYIYGGLDDTLADRVNLRIPGTNLRNYLKKSDNLIELVNVPSTTTNGITYKCENGQITLSGTASATFIITVNFTSNVELKADAYVLSTFNKLSTGVTSFIWLSEKDVPSSRLFLMQNTTTVTTTFNASHTFESIKINLTSGASFNVTLQPMLVSGSTVPTTYGPYGSMVLVENVDSNLQPLDPPKITVSKQAVFDNGGVENWTDRPSYNAADRFV